MGKKAERSERSLLYRLDHPSRRELCVRDLSRRASRWVSEGLGADSGGIRPCDWLPHSVSSGVRLEVGGGACEVLRSPPQRPPVILKRFMLVLEPIFLLFHFAPSPPSIHPSPLHQLELFSISFSPGLSSPLSPLHICASSFTTPPSIVPVPTFSSRLSPRAPRFFVCSLPASPAHPVTPKATRCWEELVLAHLFTLEPARRTPPGTRPGQPHPLDGAFPLTHRHKTSVSLHAPRASSLLLLVHLNSLFLSLSE